MSDLRLMLLFLAGLVLVLTVGLVILSLTLVRLMKNLMNEQTVENQRLRNQILAMGDLGALERLNKTTGVERTQPNPPQQKQESQNSLGYDPQDVINTAAGPAIDVMIDGQLQRLPLTDLPPELLQQGWSLDPDLDADALVDPEGTYHAGPHAD